MKKIKRIMFAFITMAILMLTSCSVPCELNYTNSEGELVELNVKPTDDKEEVYEAINALGKIEDENIGEYKSVRISMDTLLLIKDDDNLIDFKLDAELEMNDQLNMYADLELKAKYDLNFGYGFTQAKEMYIDGDVYTDSENIYLDLDTKDNGSEVEMKNKMAFDEAQKMLGSLMGSFDFDETIPSFDSDITSIPSVDFSKYGETKEEILKFIEENNITIAKTSKSSITFKTSISGEELELDTDDTLDLFFEIDVKTMLPVSIKIEANKVMKALKEEEDLKKAKFEFEMEFEYGNFAIETLKESEKDDYVDFSDFTSGILGDSTLPTLPF